MRLFLTILIAGAISSTGCTTNETDPTRVSTGDILFGKKRLDIHLKNRRKELAVLQQKQTHLQKRLNERRFELNKLNQDLINTQKNSARIDKELLDISTELKNRQKQLETLEQRKRRLDTDIALLKSNLESRQNSTQDLAKLELQAEKLERDIKVIEQAIDRTLKVRARHALRNTL